MERQASAVRLRHPFLYLFASICLGLLSWFLFGQLLRVAIENLKIGSDPWYGPLLLPATLVSGVAGAVSAYGGHRENSPNQSSDSNTKSSDSNTMRFQLAGSFALAPTVIFISLWLMS
ncbi:MAG: hypothetical protein AAFU85_29095 [Planctomycetota bacterium]